MTALALTSTNDSGFADISSEVINPAGQSEQYADGVVQPEWLQNCHANQNKFRDDIASKKTELNEALANAGDDEKKLGAFIVKAHEEVVQSSISGLLSAIAAGEAANKLKGMLAHGTWTAQLSKICSECGCGMSTMGKYMLLAQTPDAQDYAQLGISQVYQLCLIRNFVCRETKIELNLAEVLGRYGNLISFKSGITITTFKKKWAALTATVTESAKLDGENVQASGVSDVDDIAIITKGDPQANPAEKMSRQGIGGCKPQFTTFTRKVEELAGWLENTKPKLSKPSKEQVDSAIHVLENLIESLKAVPGEAA